MSVRDKASTPSPASSPAETGHVSPKEIGWLPDCVYVGGKFEAGLAFFADGAGRIARFSREPADLAVAKRLPGQAALPGLVNTHAQSWERVLRGQVDLRTRADRSPADHYREARDWALEKLSPEDVYDAARLAFMEMLLSGVTCVGECHYFQHANGDATTVDGMAIARELLRAARDVGVRIALLNGAVARAGFGQPIGSGSARVLTVNSEKYVRETDQLREFIERNHPGDDAWVGVAPHSLGAVPLDYLKTVAAYAHAKRLRLHLHLGADAGEQAACVAEFGRSPAALLAEHGLLDKRFVALHGTYVADSDIQILGTAKVAVCACPSAEVHQTAGTNSVSRLLAAGATLAVGCDGTGQGRLLDDLRLLEFQLRAENNRSAALPGDFAATLFQAVTVAGARCLGAPGGALEVGRPADFFTVNLFDPALVGASPEWLLNNVVLAMSPRAVREVWVGARQRVGQWRHPAQSAVIARFGELQKRLWSR